MTFLAWLMAIEVSHWKGDSDCDTLQPRPLQECRTHSSPSQDSLHMATINGSLWFLSSLQSDLGLGSRLHSSASLSVQERPFGDIWWPFLTKVLEA